MTHVSPTRRLRQLREVEVRLRHLVVETRRGSPQFDSILISTHFCYYHRHLALTCVCVVFNENKFKFVSLKYCIVVVVVVDEVVVAEVVVAVV